jgi:hypothetical protein
MGVRCLSSLSSNKSLQGIAYFEVLNLDYLRAIAAVPSLGMVRFRAFLLVGVAGAVPPCCIVRIFCRSKCTVPFGVAVFVGRKRGKRFICLPDAVEGACFVRCQFDFHRAGAGSRMVPQRTAAVNGKGIVDLIIRLRPVF